MEIAATVEKLERFRFAGVQFDPWAGSPSHALMVDFDDVTDTFGDVRDITAGIGGYIKEPLWKPVLDFFDL